MARTQQTDDCVVGRGVAPLVAEASRDIGGDSAALEPFQVGDREGRHEHADVEQQSHARGVELGDARVRLRARGGRLVALRLLVEHEVELFEQGHQIVEHRPGLADRQAHARGSRRGRRPQLRFEERPALGIRPPSSAVVLVDADADDADAPARSGEPGAERLDLVRLGRGESAPHLPQLDLDG